VTVRLGDVANEEAAKYGKPLDGVRVLALEQMQALPYATQLLARLGADVVKIEALSGESGRGAQPGMTDPQGRFVGATFLRNNLSKRSVTVNLKADAGRDLVLQLAPRFDVVAENFKSGALDRMGLGYEDVAAVHPSVIYASVSGFGASGSPYADWPAYASIAEAMSGIYDYVLVGDEIPRPNPVGALGDISSALFATIGILAALRHRDATGEGQRIDIAMYDATVAMTDIVTNFESLGKHRLNEPRNAILDPFRASDGWFVMQLVREHQLERISQLVGHPEWPTDPRLATREGWAEHLEDMLRPAIEEWASSMTRMQAVEKLSAAGIAAAPIQTASEVVVDPHLVDRHMLVEMERSDGVDRPVIIPGNPVKLSKVAEGPESRVPWVGEHTRSVLAEELGLDDKAIDTLVADGVVSD
jgi:crotonobetainyl-CoA:carnitine CoA-transferase CaiB-like acyl-CoA transferase